MTLATLIPLALKISVALNIFGLGLETGLSELTYLFRKPGLFVRSMLSIFVIMPVFAVIVALLFNLSPPVKIALVALSLSPIPPLLPKKILKAGGRHDYALSLLVTASVFATILIPININLMGRVFGLPMQMSAAALGVLVLKAILAPLALGIAFRIVARELADRVAGTVVTIATVLLLVSLLPVLFTQRQELISLIGNGTLAAMAAFAVVGLGTGHFLGAPGRENRPVLALSTASRHPGVALAIAQTNFPQQRLALAAVLLFFIVNAIISIPYVARYKRPVEKTTEDPLRRAA
jgi:BASS family bile acid:Na+ symporter